MNEPTAIRRIQATDLPVSEKSVLIEKVKSASPEEREIIVKALGSKNYQTKEGRKIKTL